ncbi:MAG: SLBB domain-containing protein [Candidatus Deferrimicrobium sp.]
MNSLRRLLRNVPVPRFGTASILAVLIATSALFVAPALLALSTVALMAPTFALAADVPTLPPGVTPQQAMILQDAARKGELTPEAREIVRSNPELKKYLPSQLREALEAAEPFGEGRDNTALRQGSKEMRDEKAAGERQTKDLMQTPAPHDWRKSSYVGALFSKRLTDTERDSLTHFGHELFAPTPGAAQLGENVPVGPGYIVGPGDEIIVKMWGRVEGTQRMVVDRDGKIFFPKFGSLYVAGKTFEQMRAFLKSKVSTIAEVSSDVALGQMKGIRVSVVGEVRAPGWYNVSTFQTAIQVLSIADGMKDIGSLRRIKILRGGKEIQEIDLYDLLLAGDTRADIRLQQGDVIFVPVVARLAAIAGEVRRPAIYELRDEKSLLDLVRIAGGFAPSAWKQRVQVERLSGNVSRIVLDASVEELENGKVAMDLSDGDIVRVFPIVQTDLNVVTLEGNVHRPGKYEVKPGMTVGSLLKDEMDFLPETYFDYALLTRLVPPDLHKEVISVNLREIVLEKKPEADVALQGRDKLTVYNRSAFRDLPKATISGEVRLTFQPPVQPPKAGSPLPVGQEQEKPLKTESPFQAGPWWEKPLRTEGSLVPAPGLEPSRKGESQVTTGRVALGTKTEKDFLLSKLAAESRIDNNVLTFEIQAGMRVADLVKMAGGLTRLASLDRAEIVRVDDNRNYRTIYFHLGKAVAGDPNENVLLSNEDHVQIHSIMETRYKRTVTAAGEVNNPAEYILTEGMRLSDLIFKAGGFKESAYAKEGELIRREVTPRGDLVKTQTMIVFPDKALAGDPAANVPLKEYDLLVVRQIPEWTEKIVVTLSGEVQFPGAYEAKKGERLSSVFTRAGGFTKGAYLKAAVFSRLDAEDPAGGDRQADR